MHDDSAILTSNHQVALGNFILEKQSPLAFVSLWSYTIYYYCTETKAIAEGHNNCSNTSDEWKGLLIERIFCPVLWRDHIIF